MHVVHRVRVIADRYPWLGPLLYVLMSIAFFIVQLVVASAWKPRYSWRLDTLSDLGRIACSPENGRYVCSPLHTFMNVSLVVIGLMLLIGSLLIYQVFSGSKATRIGFTLITIAEFGTMLVGLFPEDVSSQLHAMGASMPFFLGNIGLIILGISLYQVSSVLRAFTFLSGMVAMVGLYLFLSKHYGTFGVGGVERIVSYPQSFWLGIFGLYIYKEISK